MALTQVTSIGLKDGEIVNADLHSAASVALSKLASTGALGSAITATTQSASDDSTKLATTAFVQAAVTSLIDGAPGSLNTLNELAAAINDDSSYATTLTTALATKLPLAGGNLTGFLGVYKTGTNAKITLSRNESVGTDNTEIGVIDFANNTAHTVNARIMAKTSGTGNVGGQLVIETRDPSNSTLNEKLRITSGGVINIGIGNESSAVENLVELYVGGANGSHATIRGKYNRTNEYNRSEVRFGVEDNSAGKGFLAFATGTNSASERLRIDSSGNLLPATENSSQNIGASNKRWKRLYLAQGGELIFGDSATSNFFGITEGLQNNFTDQDKLSLYFRQELNFYSTSNNHRTKIDSSGNITLVTGNLYGNTSNTTELGSYTSPVGAIKRIRMTQGGEIHFGDTTNANFLGITEGTVNQFTDRDRLGIYYRNELKFYSNSNVERFRLCAGGNVKIGTGVGGSDSGGEDKLNIYGSGSQYIYLGSSDAGGVGVYFDGDSNGDMSGSDYARIMHSAADGYMQHDNWKSGGGYRFAISGQTRLQMNNDGEIEGSSTNTGACKLLLSNQDHGNQTFDHRGGRTLHSNGPGWDGNGSNDGADPIIVCSVANRGGNSDIGDALGLLLHSESQDDNDYGPMVAWSSRSNSGNYNSIYGAIVGQRTGQGADSNWNAGSLHFFTAKAGTGNYMNATADMTIDSAGHVLTPRNSRFFAVSNSGTSDTGTDDDGYVISGQMESEYVDSNGDYNTSNGRYTAPVDGNYEFHAAALLRALSSSGSGELTFYKNGSNLSSRSFGYAHVGSGSSTGDHAHMHIHCIVALSDGDYVDFRVYDLSGGLDFYFDRGLGYFSGKLLG